jgi:transposase
MLDYTIPSAELDALRATPRTAREQREPDHIKAIVLLAMGWSAKAVAEVLQVDANTLRRHFRRYQQGALRSLLAENLAIIGE